MNVLSKGCVCGHDHTTHRGEPVDLCLECSCSAEIARCQNCGGETPWPKPKVRGGYDACSRRCALQIEYALSKRVAA